MTDVPDDSGVMSEAEHLAIEESELARLEDVAYAGSPGYAEEVRASAGQVAAAFGEYAEYVPIRTCYAYSPNMVRCDMPAGHPGDHAVTSTWTDDECWTPGMPVLRYAITTEATGGGGAPVNGGHIIDLTAEPSRVTDAGTPVYDIPTPGDDGVYDPATDPSPCISCNHPRSSHAEGFGQCGFVVGVVEGQPVTCSVECLGYVG